MSACRRLVLLISIIGGFIRIWLSIPNQFVIASYLAVAEHQIMFTLDSVSCKKPPHLNVFVQREILFLFAQNAAICNGTNRSCIIHSITLKSTIYLTIYHGI